MTVSLACKSTDPSKKRLEKTFESFFCPMQTPPPRNLQFISGRRRVHCKSLDAKAGICRRVESPLFSSFVAAPKRGLMSVCFLFFFVVCRVTIFLPGFDLSWRFLRRTCWNAYCQDIIVAEASDGSPTVPQEAL